MESNKIKHSVDDLAELKQAVQDIQQRNARVEADKAWEGSWTRKIIIALLTYIVVVLFFCVAHSPKPLISAIVPTIGFVLSTLSMSVVKGLWLKRKMR